MVEDRYTRITLRIPKDLHARLTESADLRSHSMNAEIIQRLEETFWDDRPVDPYDDVIKSAEIYKNAYEVHILASQTKDANFRKSLEAYRDELIRKFDRMMERGGKPSRIGKYPWE